MSSNKTNKKLHLATIVGTRPEIIKLAAVIKKCDKHFKHSLIHTGQNWDYELNKVFFEDLNLREPDYYLNTANTESKHKENPHLNLGETMGNIIGKSYNILSDLKPDAVLILGDTNSALSAICAKRLKIPIFHMEAGNRCFDLNLPEEINRKIVDHTSDVNLPYTEHARRYLIQEGIKPEYTMVTGSPMPEVLSSIKDKINSSDILNKLNLTNNNYFVLSMHREENVDSLANFNELIASINNIAEIYNKPIVFSVHPRTKAWIDQRNTKLNKLVICSKPFGIIDYIKLQQHAYCVISDSGTLSEESAILGFPSISIRTSTERPESIDAGNMIVANLDKDNIINSINIITDNYNSVNNNQADANTRVKPFNTPKDYLDQNTSDKVVGIIQGYTSIVNQFIWRKQLAKQNLETKNNSTLETIK